MTARPIRHNAQVPDRNGKIFYTSFTSLSHISKPYREVFWLRVYGELTFAEIAALHHKTESWARVTFYRARMKMKEAIL